MRVGLRIYKKWIAVTRHLTQIPMTGLYQGWKTVRVEGGTKSLKFTTQVHKK